MMSTMKGQEMNSVYELHMFYKLDGGGGYHGHLATLHPSGQLVISLHSECCTPLEFLTVMAECQKRNLALENLPSADEVEVWLFHSMGDQWAEIAIAVGDLLVAQGEADYDLPY